MHASMTTVSIAMPVRNGLPYLGEALPAVLAQTHADLEVVICDNASHDGTSEYCREMAASDPRIRYLRFDANAGAAENFSRAFAATTAPFFAWAAHDDRFRLDFVRRCLAALEAHPAAGFCVPGLAFIDEAGTVSATLHEPAELGAADLRTRLRAYLARHHWYSIYALFRRPTLERTGLLRPVFGPDVLLLWEVLCRERGVVLDDVLLEYRTYRVKTVEGVLRGLVAQPGASAARFVHVGMWRALWDSCARLPPADRRIARRELVRWLPTGHFRELLFTDLRIETEAALAARRRLRALGAGAATLAIRPGRGLRGLQRTAPELLDALRSAAPGQPHGLSQHHRDDRNADHRGQAGADQHPGHQDRRGDGEAAGQLAQEGAQAVDPEQPAR